MGERHLALGLKIGLGLTFALGALAGCSTDRDPEAQKSASPKPSANAPATPSPNVLPTPEPVAAPVCPSAEGLEFIINTSGVTIKNSGDGCVSVYDAQNKEVRGFLVAQRQVAATCIATGEFVKVTGEINTIVDGTQETVQLNGDDPGIIRFSYEGQDSTKPNILADCTPSPSSTAPAVTT